MDSILIVDDSPANLTVLLETLKGRGYKLLVAKSGELALRIARDVHPSLILLDIIMPSMDGYEVCQQLQKDPDTKGISIIFLSALDETHDKVKGLEMGAVDYISKPFQPEEVIARVGIQMKVQLLERALKEKNTRLKARNERILQAMHEGVIGIDLDKNITFANPAAAEITGFSIDELAGRSIMGIVDSGINARAPATLDITLRSGNAQHVEKSVFWHSGGHQIPVSYSSTPIMSPDSKAPVGAVIVFSDISAKLRQDAELKTMRDELQQQKDKLTHMSRLSSMGEMASGFAHEVNQPLTAINNYSKACIRMIRHEEPDLEVLTEVMDKIATQSCRAGNIVSRIKNFVRKPQHVLEVTDCNKMIRDIVILAEVDSKENNVAIHLDLADKLPPIKVDPVQIQQVILNLLRNAMEAMRNQPAQSVGVWVKTEKYDHGFVRVSVIDRGHGLPVEAEKKLFSPFFSTKSSGMGIGLSVCHSIIEAHQGVLDFQENAEGGAIFSFTLPVAD